ncbi:nucleotidyltransferase family protein [Caulobacter sp. BE254]|uniref:nucleotidyltransferase family protein n=1 Tax=Caulobacter sp. BE254 TaxID=2817720 RepID=UPI00285D5E07|nr:nucleotidyltransferase family protein [Caulobacter sp. BE254]MDR7116504.1 putative nucleotidyltransferase [Caulobacter sp. BE254]
MTLDEALAKLRAAKPLLDRYGVRRVGVFGSTARGEAGPDSDVDVLVEFDPARVPGWEYFALGDELALVMQRAVDVVTPKSLPRLMRETVLREVVYA